MIAPPIHECPECGGCFNAENAAYDVHDLYTDFYFLCDFCGHGWEISVFRDGSKYMLDYRQRTEPKNFERFVGRLKDARAA